MSVRTARAKVDVEAEAIVTSEAAAPRTVDDRLEAAIRATEARTQSEAVATLLPGHEARLIPGKAVSDAARVEFPEAGQVTNSAVATRLRAIRKAVEDNGPTVANRRKLAALRKSLEAQRWRCRGIRTVLEANRDLEQKTSEEVTACFDQHAARWTAVRDTAVTAALVQSTPQRSELMSLIAMLEISGCDGVADGFFWINCSSTRDAVTKDRGEYSFMELPRSEFINGFRPLTEIAVGKDRKPYPIDLVPLAQRLVFQTRGSMIALGGEFNGLVQELWWAREAYKAGSVAFGNVSLEKLGNQPFTAETPATLCEAYASDDPAAKAIVVCGNHPICYDQSEYQAPPVTVHPSFLYVGKLYANEETRADLSFTNPPTNPVRDRIVASWFNGQLVSPELRNQGTALGKVPLALLTEVSNETLDGINVVFSSSNTAWSKGSHTAELELGTNLARAIVAHRMLMCRGIDLTNEDAEAEGRTLNSIFQSLSGAGRPFLNASCDSLKSRVQPQVQRKKDGTPITNAKGQPILTGKQEMVHEISITCREGCENFLVVLTL